jgi:hypothetical protein
MAPFDPYHIWLGISPDEQPPTPHRLLGIAPDETDKETIRKAALQRNAFIRQFSLGEQGKIAERLLNEIAAARDNILAGEVQTAVETPLAVETPIEPDVEKTDPSAVTPVSPILVADREPVTQEFPVSVVQSAKRSGRKVQKGIWKRPAVIICAFVVFFLISGWCIFSSVLDYSEIPAPPVADSKPEPDELSATDSLRETELWRKFESCDNLADSYCDDKDYRNAKECYLDCWFTLEAIEEINPKSKDQYGLDVSYHRYHTNAKVVNLNRFLIP